MDAGVILKKVRMRAHLSLRELAVLAHTSHSTLSAYEAGRKTPTVDTLDRIVRSAGFELEAGLSPTVAGADRAARGRELVEVLELAALFPARHARGTPLPRFGSA